ncbi:hypothetical protein [Paracoccus aestuariivivens]|uniref:Sialate O-acetylesterase domain-containing protein n=1 Tax=Paracoccus aestuariivivens TaxID=1820333 RepID=A0A6L6JA07_9RHOB|nr:hypothetical protein [Paracoccus aestuariivivens]MTH79003.1 hypothetical protein [Paracoccus aestuariivivens]
MTAPRPTVTALEILLVYGQSENRSSEDPLAATLDAATQGQIYYLSGLLDESGNAVGPSGAGWSGSGMAAINQLAPAKGFASATGLGRVSPAYTLQYCRSATWRDQGVPDKGAIIVDHGYGGRYIAEWRPDDTSPVGRNQLYWMRECKRLADEFSVQISCPYVFLFQGSSAKDQASSIYEQDFRVAHEATLAEATRLFGRPPRLVTVVNGSDVDSNGDVYATPGLQYRLTLEQQGIIATWQRIYPINDQNAHIDGATKILIGETCHWAITESEAGNPWNITYTVSKTGDAVTVQFTLRPGETLFDRSDLYDAFGGAATCPNYGFEADGGILAATPDLAGNTVKLRLANPSAAWLRFAHQVQDCYTMTDATGYTMSAHRTTLFGSEARASRFVTGQTLWRALPGFRGRFSGDVFMAE